jgi:hypothetical protein
MEINLSWSSFIVRLFCKNESNVLIFFLNAYGEASYRCILFVQYVTVDFTLSLFVYYFGEKKKKKLNYSIQ